MDKVTDTFHIALEEASDQKPYLSSISKARKRKAESSLEVR